MQMYSALPFCELLNIPILFISCLVRLAWASLWTVRLACHGARCYLLTQTSNTRLDVVGGLDEVGLLLLEAA